MARERGQGFPRHYRIIRGSDYRAVYAEGRKLPGDLFVLYFRENSLAHHRLGITVSRKIGGAVTRNRVKRLFREIFRRFCAEIPRHYDFVVNAKHGAARAGYDRLCRVWQEQ